MTTGIKYIILGKVFDCQPDKYLKRPPGDYSCVSGVSNGSKVYVLYDMDVVRAYPAYEVIYDWINSLHSLEINYPIKIFMDSLSF